MTAKLPGRFRQFLAPAASDRNETPVSQNRRPWVLVFAAAVVIAPSCGGDDGGGAENVTASPSAVTPANAEPTTTSEVSAESTTVGDAMATTTEAMSGTVAPEGSARDRRPYEVEVRTVTFVDESRPTSPPAGEQIPSRTLETALYLPVSDEPVPLIIFSHGLLGHPSKFERLMTAWATAGYAVAAPSFPLTNDTVEGENVLAADLVNQPADVVFVLDQLLGGELAPRFDPDRLGAAGLSLGGATTYMAAIDESTLDPRFRAAIVMAALTVGDTFLPADLPVMVMHGELDPLVPIDSARATYAVLHEPTYFVTLLGALHPEPFEDEEDNTIFPDRERFHPIVDAATVAFWDTYLLADPAAEPEIGAAAEAEGISTFESRAGS